VKGVHIQYPAIPNVAGDSGVLKCRVVSINKEGAKLRSETFSCGGRTIEVATGGAMSAVDEGFSGITLDVEGKNVVFLRQHSLVQGRRSVAAQEV